MGISCEINLHQESDVAFFPGSIVSGVVKYSLNEETVFKKITISLKGKENLFLDEDSQNHVGNNKYLVDVNNVVQEDEKGIAMAAGVYETEFSMMLPRNIPPSLSHKKNKGGYKVDYNVYYYVDVKFERCNFLKNSKSFKKNITVASNFMPSSTMLPITQEEEKKLTKLFSKKNDVISMKATVENCVIESAGTVLLKIEMTNDTNLKVKVVEVKLIEVLSMKSGNINEAVTDVVQSSQYKPSFISKGDKDTMKLLLDVPANAFTVRNSKTVWRNYFVEITAILPVLYQNVVLKVPIQIDEKSANNCLLRDAPPSYWETMNMREVLYAPPNFCEG